MNKKLIYIFIVLALGSFIISACSIIEQDAVGVRARQLDRGGVDIPYNVTNYTLTVDVEPFESGGVRASPNWMSYKINSRVLLEAYAYNRYYEFSNWTENRRVIGTDNNITLIINRNRNIVANFRRI